ncbi:MAG: ABC transporter permease [Rhizobiaceae bacterium]|nr:ABC transporter permease [Rhizobiaceae bacterium]
MSARADSVRRYFFAVTAQQYSRALTWTLIAPLLVLLLAAFVWPIVKFLSLSVLDPSPTLAHFAEIFDRTFYWTILLRTFRTGLIVTVMALLLGYPVAYLMANVRGLWAAAIAAIVILPLWISILVRTFVWFIFLGRTGLINKAAMGLGIVDQPMRLINTEVAVWLAMTQILLPVMILPIYASLRAIPPELGKAAEGLGASKAGVFRHVILPLSLPGVAAGAVLVFIMSLGFFITPMLIGGPRSMMIATLITEQATKFLDWPEAAALSTILMVITLAIVIVFNRALRLDRVMGSGA